MRSIVESSLLVLALGLLAGRAQAGDGDSASKSVSECTDVKSRAEYRDLGYTHVVDVTNHCKVAVTCSVSTNVNSESSSISLEPEQSASVVTFRGSPAREFTAIVKCSKK